MRFLIRLALAGAMCGGLGRGDGVLARRLGIPVPDLAQLAAGHATRPEWSAMPRWAPTFDDLCRDNPGLEHLRVVTLVDSIELLQTKPVLLAHRKR